jgi:hypothetical protein
VTTEPKRLRLGQDSLAASVSSLQGAMPSEERLAALAERLARAGLPLDDLPSEAAPASSRLERPASNRARPRFVHALRTFGPGILAVVGALGFGGGLIMTALSVREAATPLTPPESAPVVASVVPHAASAVTRGVSPALVPAPSEPVRAGAATSGAAVGPAPAAPYDTVSAPPSPPAGASPAPAARAQDAAARAQAPASPLPSPAREEQRPAAPAARAKAPAASNGAEGAPLAASNVVESEVELLKQARSALAADPLQAYALSERCRAQYPSGAFAQEREFIAISALVRLGRSNEARSRASLFRMHYPSSAYLPRLARMLGE